MIHSNAFLLLLSAFSAHEANDQAPLARKGKKQGQVANVFHEYFPWQKAPKDADYDFYGKIEMCGGMFVGYCIGFHFVYCHAMEPYASSF